MSDFINRGERRERMGGERKTDDSDDDCNCSKPKDYRPRYDPGSNNFERSMKIYDVIQIGA